MYQTACPSCGAPVAFRSAASVMAVCAYCRSTLLRDADSVRDIGKMSNVLEDYSRIQIGTSGIFQGLNFSVVGRIQLEYEDGYWNEWYLIFDDGQGGWLADASGQYVLTAPAEARLESPPEFERIQPGGQLVFDGAGFIAADVRTAKCTGGQGELPFRAGEGWTARVADFRSESRFVTLDYSDGGLPVVYSGKAVTLSSLKCQNLRETQQILESAGRLQGSVANLECPNCGASIAYRAGIAPHLICQTCHAEVAAKQGMAEVLAKNEQLEQRTTTLALGDVAKFDNRSWTLIGIMECRETGDPDESSAWVEYLLHNPDEGFRWIVESMEGWDLVEVLDVWPTGAGGGSVKLREQTYSKLYDYGAVVTWAAGAFNWRIHVGDTVAITDYRTGAATLTAERSANELTWSRALRVQAKSVMGWFGKPQEAVQEIAARNEDDPEATRAFCRKVGWIFTALIVVLNLPVLFSGGGEDAIWLPGMGLFGLWWPLLKSDSSSSVSGDDD